MSYNVLALVGGVLISVVGSQHGYSFWAQLGASLLFGLFVGLLRVNLEG